MFESSLPHKKSSTRKSRGYQKKKDFSTIKFRYLFIKAILFAQLLSAFQKYRANVLAAIFSGNNTGENLNKPFLLIICKSESEDLGEFCFASVRYDNSAFPCIGNPFPDPFRVFQVVGLFSLVGNPVQPAGLFVGSQLFLGAGEMRLGGTPIAQV